MIERIDTNFGAPTIPLPELVPNRATFALRFEYRSVTGTGSYLQGKQLLVRNRVLNGAVGFEQIAPFVLRDGSIVLVDRGWLPAGNSQDLPDSVPPIPSGQITLVGHLLHSQGTDGRTAPEGQLAFANVEEAIAKLQLPVDRTYKGVYVALSEEKPAHPKPKALPRPSITEGNHFSYALQWILFGLLGFAGLFWAIREEYLHWKAAQDPSFRLKKRNRIGDSDARFEDEASA